MTENYGKFSKNKQIKYMSQGGTNKKQEDDNLHSSGNNLHHDQLKPINRSYNNNYFEGNHQNRKNSNNSHGQGKPNSNFLVLLNKHSQKNETHTNLAHAEKNQRQIDRSSSSTVNQHDFTSTNSNNPESLNASITGECSVIADPSVIAYETAATGPMVNYVQAQPFYPSLPQNAYYAPPMNPNVMAAVGQLPAPKTTDEKTVGLQLAPKNIRPVGAVNFNARLSIYPDGSDLPVEDILTLRYFYNLGLVVYRKELNIETGVSELNVNESSSMIQDFNNRGYRHNGGENNNHRNNNYENFAWRGRRNGRGSHHYVPRRENSRNIIEPSVSPQFIQNLPIKTSTAVENPMYYPITQPQPGYNIMVPHQTIQAVLSHPEPRNGQDQVESNIQSQPIYYAMPQPKMEPTGLPPGHQPIVRNIFSQSNINETFITLIFIYRVVFTIQAHKYIHHHHQCLST